MKLSKYNNDWVDIDRRMYGLSLRAFKIIKKLLRMNINIHSDTNVDDGSIFLFNHFSRIETFIPQFLIHEKNGSYCYSVGSGEFFTNDDILSSYLKKVGVVPHDHPRLFPILAKQILHGHKVVIFPEGGMVKDHRVVDTDGHYNMLCQTSMKVRKQHTGAAVLAHGLEVFKFIVRNAYRDMDMDKLLKWQQELEFDSLDELLLAVERPTKIVPSNITFYPLRTTDNVILKAFEYISKGLTLRQTEELMVEGNLITKDTDMDVVMGEMISTSDIWHSWSSSLIESFTNSINSLDDVFFIDNIDKSWKGEMLHKHLIKSSRSTRDIYTKDIYSNVTINLSHLTSCLLMYRYKRNISSVSKKQLYKELYLLLKTLQHTVGIRLHDGLVVPQMYSDILSGENVNVLKYIDSLEKQGLLIIGSDTFYLSGKFNFNVDPLTIRVENLLVVYYNEIQPVFLIGKVVKQVINSIDKVTNKDIALHLLDDQKLSLLYDKSLYDNDKYNSKFSNINSSNNDPFILFPKKSNGVSVLLVHGLLSSPAEVRGFGDYLCGIGYTVIGARIIGHGTSPYDLMQYEYSDWIDSVYKYFEISCMLSQNIVIVGFSTGGVILLRDEFVNDPRVKSVVVISAPIFYIDSRIKFVPIINGINTIVRTLTSGTGVKTFFKNIPENEHINYWIIPTFSINEIGKLVKGIKNTLCNVKIPTLIIFSKDDTLVSVNGADYIYNNISSKDKEMHIIGSDCHGILYNNSDLIWERISMFIEKRLDL
jgi:esterase/lipase